MPKLYPVYAACVSNTGKRRLKNEDNFYIKGRIRTNQLSESEPLFYEEPLFRGFGKYLQFYAVFDGMGGGNYGEVASQTAAEAAKLFIEDDRSIQPYDITVSLNKMCNTLNEKVFHTANNLGTNKMGTTMVSLLFYQGMVWFCNLGDSKSFIFRDKQLFQLSRDHTDAEEMVQNNITGRKPYVTQYLGIDPEETRIEPYISSTTVGKDDIYLICSDGLTDMVPKETIQTILLRDEDPRTTVKRLLNEALNAGGADNITIIVIK